MNQPCACNNIHPLPPPAGDIVGQDPRSAEKRRVWLVWRELGMTSPE